MAEVMTDAVTWEYSYVTASANGLRKLVVMLNDLSAEGWELVAMDDVDRTLGMNALTAIIRRRVEPLPEPAVLADGWYPDPAGRFDRRYWNGRAWTFQVTRDADRSQHRDPPTRLAPTPNLQQ
jgi:hypothetical protein